MNLSYAIKVIFRNVPTTKNIHSCTKISRLFSSKSQSSRTLKATFKLGLAGVAVGAAIGTGYSIHYLNHPRSHILNEQTFINPVEAIPKLVPSKSVSHIIIY